LEETNEQKMRKKRLIQFLKKILPPKLVTRYRISKLVGYKIRINNPQTFNEKIQWLKLYYKNPLLSVCADKIGVRKYVAENIGENYLIPIHKIYNSYKDIKIEDLPNSFALKAAHGSKWNIICHQKSMLNSNEFYCNIKKWGNTNYFWFGYEYAYKNIKPRYICEQLILDKGKMPNDFKFFCFNGNPTYIQVDVNRYDKHQRIFYSPDWELLPFTLGFEKYNGIIEKPKKLSEALQIAKKLSKEFPFVRVDLYLLNEQIYFGEMTFYPGEGSERFTPSYWDRKMGELLKLPL
jgi:hypothetical protein